MTETLIIDFAISMFVIGLVSIIPVTVYAVIENYNKTRQTRDALLKYPPIKTVRRPYGSR